MTDLLGHTTPAVVSRAPSAVRPRVEHIGSLRPPDHLVAAVAGWAEGRLALDQLRALEDECVRDIVAEQERHGLPVVTDGEFRRLRGRQDLAARIGEVARFGLVRARQLPAGPHAPSASSISYSLPLSPSRPDAAPRANALLDEYRFAAQRTDRPVKLTLLGPDYLIHAVDLEQALGDADNFVEFFQNVVSFEQALIREAVAAGCPYVQLDAPGYLAYGDPACLAEMRGRGVDPVGDLRWAVQADNAVVEGIGAVAGLHMCRSYSASSGPQSPVFDPFAEIIFNELVHQRFLIDVDTAAPNAFAALRFVPKGKQVVLGLVDSRTPRVETVDEVLRLVDEASCWLSADDMALSPTCGFASLVADGQITNDQQWRKLDVLVEAAARVWD